MLRLAERRKEPRITLQVLIVGEGLADRESLTRIVCAAGHRVLVAETADDCISSARTHQPDAILIDADMPDLDAFAATRLLKADIQTCDIRIVFMTGKNAKADVAWGTMLGAQGFVTKPCGEADILAQLEALAPTGLSA
jgi:CheY-like chemotaxis protein